MGKSLFINEIYLPELGPGAGLSIWGFRACARGGGNCCTVVKGFERMFGTDAPDALRDTHTFAAVIGHEGHRTVSLAMPGCARVTGDELSIIACMSCAQAKDAALRDAHLNWLMGRHPDTRLTSTVTRLSDYYAKYGLQIEMPDIQISQKAPSTEGLLVLEAGRA